MLKYIKRLTGSLQNNRSFNNVAYSLLAYLISPIMILVTTPLLLHYLGAAEYGIWILIQSVISVLGISNFGIGSALIKIGAEWVDSDPERFDALIHAGFTLSLLVSCVMNVIVWTFGADLVRLFASPDQQESFIRFIYFAGAITGLRVISGVFSAAYMSKQRYDLNSKVNMIVNFISSIAFALLAYWYRSLNAMIAALLIFSVALVAVNYFVAKRTVPGFRIRLRLERTVLRKLCSYSIFSWLQVIITAFNTQADKLIVGGLLGSKALAYYTICIQLAIKIHEVPAAAGGFLLARFSSLYENKQFGEMKKLYQKSQRFAAAFILLAGAFMFAGSHFILKLWIGPEFADQHAGLLQLLVVAVSLGALGVIPYYGLNGTGYVRLNTFFTLSMSLISCAAYFMLMPVIGLTAAFWGRILAFPLVAASVWVIYQKVLRPDRSETAIAYLKDLPD